MIGYEAVAWNEAIEVPQENDFPTPAVSVGLYDWVIAVDHLSGASSLMVRDLKNGGPRRDYLQDRLGQVLRWIDEAESQTDDLAQISEVSAGTISEEVTGASSNQGENDLGVTSNFSSEGFQAAVKDVIDRIRRGDSFQVNLAQRLLHQASCSSAELYLRLRQENPAPFAAYYGGDGFEVLSSSPEGFLRVQQRHVKTCPIKGTIPRTGDEARDRELANQLTHSVKDQAENVMIVDLMRNDLSRVCRDDSVEVTQLCELESYQYVQHLVSVVEGDLREGEDVVSLLQACFPGGSVTGAPKIEAMKTIAELEPHPRGPYCGSIGYITDPGTADFNILIRTITAAGGHWQIPVGGGITARSQPDLEEAETWAKAKGMLQALRQF